MTHHTNADAEINALLADLWQRHLPSMRERLELLDRVAKESDRANLDEPLRAEGQSIAHKLAGNLGMFGYQQAGEIASRIEHLLKDPTAESLSRVAPLVQELHSILEPHL